MSASLLRLLFACCVFTTTGCIRSSLYRHAQEEEEEELTPVVIPPLEENSPWVALQSTDATYCALSRGGEVWCWGSNARGALGYDTTPDTHAHTPHQVEGLPPMAALLLDDTRMSCARAVTGEVWCWGEVNAPGLEAEQSKERPSRAIEILSQDKSFGANRFGFCHLDMQHHVTCQRLQYTSNEDDGPSITYGPSWQPLEGREVAQLVTGDAHFCAATTDGEVWCWGEPGPGSLGTSLHAADAREAVQLTALHHIVELSARGDRTCARRIDGAAWCWGGMIQFDFRERGPLPVTRLDGLDGAVALSSAGTHACAASESGALTCWNDRETLSELAFLDDQPSTRAVPIEGMVVDVTSSAQSSCALTAAGEVWCWGRNDHNELGALNQAGTFFPQPIKGLQQIRTFLYREGQRPCVLRDTPEGEQWCWGEWRPPIRDGRDASGGEIERFDSPWPLPAAELTHITNDCAVHDATEITCLRHLWNQNELISVSASGPIAEIAASEGVLCARLQRGEVECWKTSMTPPQAFDAIQPLSGITSMAAQYGDLCFVRQDGEIDCLSRRDDLVNQRALLRDLGVSPTLPRASRVSAFGYEQRCLLTPPPAQAWCWYHVPVEELLYGTPLWQIEELPEESDTLYLLYERGMGCATSKAGGLSCWGGRNRQLFGYLFEERRAREIPWGRELTGELLLTSDFGCGIFGEEREVRCWGSNAHAELGVIPVIYSDEAMPIALPARSN